MRRISHRIRGKWTEVNVAICVLLFDQIPNQKNVRLELRDKFYLGFWISATSSWLVYYRNQVDLTYLSSLTCQYKLKAKLDIFKLLQRTLDNSRTFSLGSNFTFHLQYKTETEVNIAIRLMGSKSVLFALIFPYLAGTFQHESRKVMGKQ